MYANVLEIGGYHTGVDYAGLVFQSPQRHQHRCPCRNFGACSILPLTMLPVFLTSFRKKKLRG